MELVFYKNKSGKEPVKDFLKKLSKEDQARISACLISIQELGFDTPRVQFRQIHDGLWEIKIRTKNSGYRIFYVTLSASVIVLLHGYKKQSQKAPKKEIETAEKRMMEVIQNENVNTKRFH